LVATIDLGGVVGSPVEFHGISPGSVQVGSTTVLTITGIGFTTTPLMDVVESGTTKTHAEGISLLPSPQIISTTELLVELNVASNATPREVDVVAYRAGGVVSARIPLVVLP
jgi:hypothetical protein